MVWYQKFEYAVGHWLQKATEHMIGCVLCSPGCFSLFRSYALMDDNVARRYASKVIKKYFHAFLFLKFSNLVENFAKNSWLLSFFLPHECKKILCKEVICIGEI